MKYIIWRKGQLFVALSFEQQSQALLIDGVGVLRMLETIYQVNQIKFYHVSTSELYGKVQDTYKTRTQNFI